MENQSGKKVIENNKKPPKTKDKNQN